MSVARSGQLNKVRGMRENMVQDAGGAKGSQIMLPQDAVDHR